MAQTVLMPPPPAAVAAIEPPFQVFSDEYAPPAPVVVSDVPPTPVMYGCEAGSSTLRLEPLS